MSAFNAALAILMQAHGAVTVSEDCAGIPYSLDGLLINGVNPDATRNSIVKTAGMGEEALTIKNRPSYTVAVDAESTNLSGPWINRHPGEVFTYDSFTLYSSLSTMRHGFPTGNACSWSVEENKQALRAGDLRSAPITLKLLFKPTLSSQVITPAAAA